MVTINYGYRYLGDVEHVSLSEREKTSAAVWHGLCTATSLFLPSRLSTACVARTATGMMRGRGVVRVVPQAERSDAMQQVIIARNDKEEVWVETPTGHLLAACFFKAPDETPEELEHMGYPQLLHLYPAEAILVGRGLPQTRWKRSL